MFTYDEGFSNAIGSTAKCEFIDWQQKKPHGTCTTHFSTFLWHRKCVTHDLFLSLYEGTFAIWLTYKHCATFFTCAKHKQNWQRLARAYSFSSCRVFVCLFSWKTVMKKRKIPRRPGTGRPVCMIRRIYPSGKDTSWWEVGVMKTKKEPVCFRYFSDFLETQ